MHYQYQESTKVHFHILL